MKEDKNIEVIKDLVYENSTRKMLLEQSSSAGVGPVYKYIRAIAAIAILGLVCYQLVLWTQGDDQRLVLAETVYELPVLGKSRGQEVSLVDQYITAYNTKQWDDLRPKLESNHASEKDAFALVHMYYSSGELENASTLIAATEWKDEYNKENIAWVSFLIAVRQGQDKEQLVREAQLLSPSYQAKASALMAEL